MKKGTKVKWVLNTGRQLPNVVIGGFGTVITDEDDGNVLVQKEGDYYETRTEQYAGASCLDSKYNFLEEHVVIRCAVTWLTIQN